MKKYITPESEIVEMDFENTVLTASPGSLTTVNDEEFETDGIQI